MIYIIKIMYIISGLYEPTKIEKSFLKRLKKEFQECFTLHILSIYYI